ncbi:2-phospho-L-lactate guanylyltransferase [Microbulbifer sp. SAOS-129_SWC]|uniref:2-phospho-L-lactate guanylyltransferase n=1 Tax=Microbulbifer sp. SAOS-129_SWC TaxID=3145235 RepID=UPI003217ABEA
MWALLPLKEFAHAKQRLAGILSAEERVQLFEAMVKDVLSVLRRHPDIERTLIISDDPLAKKLAADYGAELLSEAGLQVSGLNPAVQAGVDVLARRGIDDVMVIHGDMPLLTPNEITRLLQAHRQQGGAIAGRSASPMLTIIPDERREGTNCLVCTPASTLTYCYGRQSFLAHATQASRIGLPLQVLRLPGLMCDIDTPVELVKLVQLASSSVAVHSYDCIHSIGLAGRLGLATSEPTAPVGLHYHRVS